jgi:LysM repeat protein
MVDRKFENHENFIINENYDDEEVRELNREDYYDDHSSILPKKYLTPVTIGGAGLVVIVILLVILFSGPNEADDNQQLQSLQAKIQQLEQKLSAMGSVDQALDRVGKLEQKSNLISEKFERFNSTVATQIDQIIKELGALHQKSSQKPQAVKSVQKDVKPRFHQVRPKETLWGISRQYGLTVDQLRSYNNMSTKATLQPGQKLKLTPN